MKAKDLRERSAEDLKELEKSLSGDKFQNRLKNFTNRLDDTSALKKARRDLARVKTILVQKAHDPNAPAKTARPSKAAGKKLKSAASAAPKKAAAPAKAPAAKKAPVAKKSSPAKPAAKKSEA
jgi:large subunit ribosomal protein L29